MRRWSQTDLDQTFWFLGYVKAVIPKFSHQIGFQKAAVGGNRSGPSLGRFTSLFECIQRCARGENSHILPVSEETRPLERRDRQMTESQRMDRQIEWLTGDHTNSWSFFLQLYSVFIDLVKPCLAESPHPLISAIEARVRNFYIYTNIPYNQDL